MSVALGILSLAEQFLILACAIIRFQRLIRCLILNFDELLLHEFWALTRQSVLSPTTYRCESTVGRSLTTHAVNYRWTSHISRMYALACLVASSRVCSSARRADGTSMILNRTNDWPSGGKWMSKVFAV
jgi:hypothetical protein